MPTTFQTSFASAAAGGTQDNSVNRRDGSNGNEWSRNRSNGATQTFRRSSHAATQSRDQQQSTGPYIPPHLNQPPGPIRNGAAHGSRYSREDLLDLYRQQKDAGLLDRNLHDVFQAPWNYHHDGVHNEAAAKDQAVGAEICWNAHATHTLLSLQEMTEDEVQLFSGSVNAPVKAGQAKDGGSITTTNRRTSLSNHTTQHSTSGTVGSRPGVRRRETGESITGNTPLSPTETNSAFRSDVGANALPSLLRRRTDVADDETRAELRNFDQAEQEGRPSFTGAGRINTGPLSAGLNGPAASPWSAGGPRSAFESMGSFGNLGQADSPLGRDSEKRPGFGTARSTSRFKDLLAKASSEEFSPSIKEKSSQNALEKLPEEDHDFGQARLKDVFKTRPNRSETNPYDDIPRTGSAALSTDSHGVEHTSLSAIHNTPGVRRGPHDTTSPANTNPYQSPAAHRGMEENPEGELSSSNSYSHLGRPQDAFERQTSTFAGHRPGVTSLSSLSGWPDAGSDTGNAARDKAPGASAFGNNIFSPMGGGYLPSPASNFGGFFSGGSSFGGSAGRSSRLGGMFPPAMQDQMRSDSRNDVFDTTTDTTGSRDPFGSGSRRPDAFRNLFDDRPSENPYDLQPGTPTTAGVSGASQQASTGIDQAHLQSGAQLSSSIEATIPTTQQRQMVMPDRMRWIYRDPQGNIQGPWSGLEMHDWFKAGFFTAELQVKKLEDVEYEPLAQLVRRIGNSREPFLVPQIGVPHGPTPPNQGNHWATNMGPSGAQPPFASSFPSFGTTLTAEQQNALERRKQEEQYLMARQKEHLAQQQMYMKQMQMQGPGGTHPLQHHASAHSLQSQPSFGSITSPGGYQPSSMQAPAIQPPQPLSGFAGPHSAAPALNREEDVPGIMERLSFNQRMQENYAPSPIGQQPAAIGSGQPARHMDQAHTETHAHERAFLGEDGRNERLEEFQNLRSQIDEDSGIATTLRQQPIGAQRSLDEPLSARSTGAKVSELSLTQQVQRQAAANEKATAHEQHFEVPPVSVSPLPAPTPNRNRQHVADALAAESRSQSQTPVEPSSLAPWAAEGPKSKGPSLKEIQEAEAKRAAEQEKAHVAARREQAEKERLAATTLPPPAPGLPAASNWASSLSPASPGPAGNVWGAKQPAKPSTGTATKKTLAQIQKEEEARKQKMVAHAAAQAQAQATAFANANSTSGKRYAELASKTAPSQSPISVSTAWTTVGASGKVKTPSTPTTLVAVPQPSRSVSASATAMNTSKARPTLQTMRTTSVSNKSKADEEFTKWIRTAIGPELKAGINEEFIQTLMALPPEKEVIRDIIYGGSDTLSGDHVAEEWIRRRKLADKGVVEPAAESGSLSTSKNQGWSEVAKKGPAKEEPATSFKMVASKKKAKK